MNLRRHLVTSVLLITVSAVFLGVLYPLAITGLAQLLFPEQANGQLVVRDGRIVGSALIGQPFSSPGYFWSRPSAAGAGYDASASGGSNLGPTNRRLITRVSADVERLRLAHASQTVPVDLVTTSASGLDPHVSPAAAEFQVARVAQERGVPEREVRDLVARFTTRRALGVLGEPVVNVLLLNLALDERHPMGRQSPPNR